MKEIVLGIIILVFFSGCICPLFDGGEDSDLIIAPPTVQNTTPPQNNTQPPIIDVDFEEDDEPQIIDETYEEPPLSDALPTTEEDILVWLSTPTKTSNFITDDEERNHKCVDDTLLRYEKLTDATYGIWDTKYRSCGNNKRGKLFLLLYGLTESPNGNKNWEYVSHDDGRGIYTFKNTNNSVQLMYLVSDHPEGYVGTYSEPLKFINYFVSSICRLPECSSGQLNRNDVKTFTINGYDAYMLHNSDWSGIEAAFFATPCQTNFCNEYGLTYIYFSIRGEPEDVLTTMHEISNNLKVNKN